MKNIMLCFAINDNMLATRLGCVGTKHDWEKCLIYNYFRKKDNFECSEVNRFRETLPCRPTAPPPPCPPLLVYSDPNLDLQHLDSQTCLGIRNDCDLYCVPVYIVGDESDITSTKMYVMKCVIDE